MTRFQIAERGAANCLLVGLDGYGFAYYPGEAIACLLLDDAKGLGQFERRTPEDIRNQQGFKHGFLERIKAHGKLHSLQATPDRATTSGE